MVVIPLAGNAPVNPYPGGRNDPRKLAALLVPLAAIAAVAVMVAGSASAAASPIVIGWAFDSKGAMAPFDGPALAAAQIRVNQVNATRRRQGAAAQDHHL